MRWNQATATSVNNEKVDAFLKEIAEVCEKHGFSLSHEDEHGGFVVESYSKERADWLRGASIGMTVK